MENYCTVKSRSNGNQGTIKFYLLLAEFCYSQLRKLKEINWKNSEFAFIIDRIPLVTGLLERGSTVYAPNYFLALFLVAD